MVTTRLDGAAPEEVETEITEKIEEAVNTINGIDELRSVSVEGVSQVFVTFTLDKSIEVAAQDVRDHVSTAHRQPAARHRSAGGAQVRSRRGRPSSTSPSSRRRGVRDTTELADKRVRRQIESIPGVGQVILLGGRKRQINVWLDPVQLRSLGAHAARGAARHRRAEPDHAGRRGADRADAS